MADSIDVVTLQHGLVVAAVDAGQVVVRVEELFAGVEGFGGPVRYVRALDQAADVEDAINRSAAGWDS